ncbi:MAG: ATP-dependent Clp protease proteolytic subunit, partial [Solirubrobacteraceae bacterium]|nr:ATP-dependent Clp protease proteolytic subunit [Solirubrobacteraceae bacterium]
QATDIEIHAREIIDIRKRVDTIYAKHTGRSMEQLKEDMERDRFLSAEQSIEYGIIDQVLTRESREGKSAPTA